MTFAVSAPARARRGTLPVAVGAAVVVALVGIGVGLLWQVVAPRIEIIRVDQGFIYAESEPEQAVAGDGWFMFLGLAAGLVLGVLAWVLLRRHRGLPVLAALVLGSLVGAWLGWWFGISIDHDAFQAAAAGTAVGGHLDAPLSLGMTGLDSDKLWPPKVTGVVLAQALAVAVVYTTFAGFSSDPLLRPAGARTPVGPPYWPAALPPTTPVPQSPALPPWPPPVPPALPASSLPPPPPAWSEPLRSEPSAWPQAAPPAGQPVRSDPPASSGPGGPAGPTGWPVPPGSD